MDTSRVALAIARQRLITSKFDYFTLADESKGVSGGFNYKTVPHITLKSIAQNTALDPVFAKWEPILAKKLEALNNALANYITPMIRADLVRKLALKEIQQGKRSITDADRRRWILPIASVSSEGAIVGGWQEWEIPFDTDPDYPEELAAAVIAYRAAWRGKMDEVNKIIAASAAQEELVDKPNIKPNVLRVSGPFTVEGVRPAESSLAFDDSPIGGIPEDELETFDPADTLGNAIPVAVANAESFLAKMTRLLRQDGVRFPNNRELKFTDLRPLSEGSVLHAEGEWQSDDTERCAAIVFGPEFGSLTADMVEQSLRAAHKARKYDDLIFAAFAFDATAQAAIESDPNPHIQCHLAHIRPDVMMSDLLKATPSSQLFTVSGSPRVELRKHSDGQFSVIMEGVDIYNPVDNSIRSAGADKVAAWFLDTDYNEQTFCICQAFFPDKSSWEKLARELTGTVDADRFATFAGNVSLPFPIGKNKLAAVKVIDPRGNEVMRVLNLFGEVRYAE